MGLSKKGGLVNIMLSPVSALYRKYSAIPKLHNMITTAKSISNSRSMEFSVKLFGDGYYRILLTEGLKGSENRINLSVPVKIKHKTENEVKAMVHEIAGVLDIKFNDSEVKYDIPDYLKDQIKDSAPTHATKDDEVFLRMVISREHLSRLVELTKNDSVLAGVSSGIARHAEFIDPVPF